MNLFKIVITLMKKGHSKSHIPRKCILFPWNSVWGFVNFSNWTEQTSFKNNNNSQKDDIQN